MYNSRPAILIAILWLVSSCASTATNRFMTVDSNRPDGPSSDWTTQTNTDDFSSWRQSVARGSIRSGDGSNAYIRVQNRFFGVVPGDGFICGETNCTGTGTCWTTLRADLAWKRNSGEKFIENMLFEVDEGGDELQHLAIFTNPPLEDFLCKLNSYDELAIKYTDKCGTYTYVNFDIEGSHHLKVSQLIGGETIMQCATYKNEEEFNQPRNDNAQRRAGVYPEGFTSGEMRLVKLGLFSGYGSALESASSSDLLSALYQNAEWEKLTKELSGKMGDDAHYFLLGVAAERLGYVQAARIYYGLSIEMSKRPLISKCIGEGASLCFNHRFPEDAILRLANLENE